MSHGSVHAEALALARRYAEVGRFGDFLDLCRQITESHPDDLTVELDLGALLAGYGFLADARVCYEKAQALAPTDQRATINLANLARDAGDHAVSRQLYDDLRQRLPDHPVIRRNALTSLEYDPAVSDAERLAQANAWGAWAIARAGGARPRPALRPLKDRPLRVGYVSADFCQHTVGLFLKDILHAHDPTQVQVFAYSAGTVQDWN